MTIRFLICGLFCLCFSTLIAPLVLYLCKKLKASQSILHYVDKHKSKEGTPTMGGLIFIVTTIFSACFMLSYNTYLAWFTLAVTFCYALLGFLDDFLKIHNHHNEGLRPYQKIIGQVGIAVVIAAFVYISGWTTLKFFAFEFDIGWLIIPLVVLVMVATVNSVNLTDGLDGLAGGVSFVYCLVFGIILACSYVVEFQNMAMLCFGMSGALLGFLLFNCFPAKIFMGDTGSLALGGFIGITAVLSRLELLLPIMGIMFVLSALSDIIQVVHYKRTKRRVFLMAPLHHHFEQKGVHENRIVIVYIVITTAVCISVLAGVLAVGI